MTKSLTFIVDVGPVIAVEIQPLLPPQSGEKQPDDPMRFFLDALLEFIVSQVSKKMFLYFPLSSNTVYSLEYPV
jgi:hypothetical protein